MTTADTLVGATLGGRYNVQSRVAGGGMATVYVAHDLRLDRRVALKVMHPALAGDVQFVQRFINEAHSVAKLSHPNVVQVYDQGTDQGHVYLAMEYVPGRTLREVLKERTRLGPAEALRVMMPVLAAVGAAHKAGMVHRDMKPENVLITQDGRIKVVDFGLARVVEAAQKGLTKTGTLMGTAAYLSPEQISQSSADARTDVYACGIMLYELLTGQQPHTGDTPISIAYQHVNEDVPRPSRVVRGIPATVDSLVVRATERDPRYRLTDAGQFLAAVFEVEKALSQNPADVASGPTAAVADASGGAASGGGRDGSNQTLAVDLETSELPAVRYEDYEDDRPPRPSMRYPLMLVGAVLLVAAVGFGWWMALGRYESVPNLVGVERDALGDQLSPLGLKFRVADDTVYSDDAPVGTVAVTDPAVGDRVLPGEIITVSLSEGPQNVEMPAVAGEPVAEARELLEDQGITSVEEEEISSYDNPPGTVISSDPAAGEQADREGVVVLTISAGFEVPDVVGRDADDARQTLEARDLTVETTEESSNDVPQGQVISMDPEGGATVGAGQTVRLTVSSGPEQIEIPDIRGWRVGEARRELEELGFEVTVFQVLGNRVGDYNPKGAAQEGAEIQIWTSPFGGEDGDDRDRGDDDD